MCSCANDTRAEFATCADTPQRHWRFGGAAARCGALRRSAVDARALLAGQRLVFAGDSIARNLYGATLRLLGQPGKSWEGGEQGRGAGRMVHAVVALVSRVAARQGACLAPAAPPTTCTPACAPSPTPHGAAVAAAGA